MKFDDSTLSFSEISSKENRQPTIVLLFGTLLLVTWRYYGSRTLFLANIVSVIPFINTIAAMAAEWYNYLTALVLFGVLSILVIRYIFKEPIGAFGLQWGDWKFWLPATGILGIIMIVMGYIGSKDPHFIAEYPLYKGAGASWQMFTLHAVGYLLFYIGWETFFRGLMQHALSPRFGVWGAILVQSAISCIVHIGKPTGEIYGAVFGGIIWGIVVYRSRTILPAILTHWLLGLSLDFFICFGG